MNTSTTHEITARDFSLDVLRRLRQQGHESYWAGGCVRDLLLNKVAKDFDIATSAHPDAVRRLFRRTLAVGASFGVIVVLGPKNLQVEVATFRSDGTYSDGRRPDAVQFASALEDAQRRDFTINGMFFDPLTEQLHDFVGGQADLERGIIRAIGDPNARFEEDKLRLLRAVRFAARLQFAIEPTTAAAIRQMADQIGVVSEERILTELRELMCQPRRQFGLDLLCQLHLFEPLFPEVAAAWSANPALRDQVRQILHFWPTPVSLPLAFAGLLHHWDTLPARQTTDDWLRDRKWANDDRERLLWLLQHQQDLYSAPDARLAKLKRLFAHPGFAELLQLHAAVLHARNEENRSVRHCQRLLAELPATAINPPPLLTGQHLIEAGLTPGPRFKELLETIRDEQLDGTLTNTEQALQRIRELL